MRIAAGLIALVLVTAAAGSAQTVAPAALTVVMAPTVDATAFYYATKTGMFEKAGLAITVKQVASGNLGIVAVVGGDAQIGFANTLSEAQAHVKGIPLFLIAGAGLYDANAPIARIWVAADSPIRSAKDLEDRVVAVSGLHDLLALSVRAWLAQEGIDSTKIRFVEMPPSTMQAALEAKRVDAISTFEPWSSNVDASGKGRTLAYPYTAIGRSFAVTAWFAHGSWLATHRDVALRFGQVIRQATEYTNAHLGEMIPIVAESTGMTQEVVRNALKAKTAPTVVPAQVQPMIDAAAKLGELPAAFPARDLLL